jgi:hypothetical protein
VDRDVGSPGEDLRADLDRERATTADRTQARVAPLVPRRLDDDYLD